MSGKEELNEGGKLARTADDGENDEVDLQERDDKKWVVQTERFVHAVEPHPAEK